VSAATYLGDGMYAESGAGMIAVWTSDGITESKRIYFEPETFRALVVFAAARGFRLPSTLPKSAEDGS
jgi:hypothetical protein